MDVLIGIREKNEICVEPRLALEGKVKMYSVARGLWFLIAQAMRLKVSGE